MHTVAATNLRDTHPGRRAVIMLENVGPCTVTCHYGGSCALQSCHELLKIDTASYTVWTAAFKDLCCEQTLTKQKKLLHFKRLIRTFFKKDSFFFFTTQHWAVGKKAVNAVDLKQTCSSYHFFNVTESRRKLDPQGRLKKINFWSSPLIILWLTPTPSCFLFLFFVFHSLCEVLLSSPPPNLFSSPSRCRITSYQSYAQLRGEPFISHAIQRCSQISWLLIPFLFLAGGENKTQNELHSVLSNSVFEMHWPLQGLYCPEKVGQVLTVSTIKEAACGGGEVGSELFLSFLSGDPYSLSNKSILSQREGVWQQCIANLVNFNGT